jgi:multisubunit Na+/H+ antiporter MnhF subunit
VNKVIQFGLHPSMDDNIVIFVTIMKVFATTIVYSITCTKKYRPHMTNFAILIGLLSFQCTHPWVFHDIIFNS